MPMKPGINNTLNGTLGNPYLYINKGMNSKAIK
jgi:hypothetical protein